MSESENDIVEWGIQSKLPLWIAYSLMMGFGLWVLLEAGGITNWVELNLPLGASDFGLISSAMGTILLTFGLLLLYSKQAEIQAEQTKIQKNQELLMEQQHTPYLTGEVTFLNINSVKLAIRNSGNGPAFDVEAEWEVAGERRSWEVPSLPPGEEYGFPVIVDDDNWLLSTGEIKEFLNKRDSSSVIEYSLTCEDRFREKQKFTGSVDFGAHIRRSEADEIWDSDPVEEISNDIGKIQRDIRKIRRYKHGEDRATNWQHRIQQNKVLYELIQDAETLSVEELNSLTGISDRNIEFRLQGLDAAGFIYYNSSRKIAKPKESKQETTLEDF